MFVPLRPDLLNGLLAVDYFGYEVFAFVFQCLFICLAWKLVGTSISFLKVIILTSYVDAAITILVTPIFAPAFSVIKRVKSFNLAENGPVTPAQETDFIIFSAVFMMALAISLIWWVISWGAYRTEAGAGKIKSASAFMIAFVLIVPSQLLLAYLVPQPT